MTEPEAHRANAAPPAFGALLRRLRLAAGLAQETLAERARISVQAVSALERGVRRAPQRQTLLAIVEALDLDQSQRRELEAAAVRTPKPREAVGAFVHSAGSRFAPGRHNLPASLNAFFGREPELEEVAAIFLTARLLTITGIGGIGKTRFGIALASGMAKRYDDGICFVELAPVADVALVPYAILEALSLREEGSRPIETTLIENLKDRSTLLFLDNCEHVGEACALLCRQLLQACPKLHILATSRTVLGIGGEVTYRLAPLGVRDGVHLFVERARALSPSFTLTTADDALVASSVRRLDGIPLAIELAAARTKVMSLETLSARLDNRFRLLTGGERAALNRHQTLRAAIDWSYELLDDAERRLFARLAIFAGSWTLEAAEHICSGEGIDEGSVLDLLSNLVDKSLVQAEPQGDVTRFRYLETVRAYALEKFAASAESRRVRSAFVEWYTAFVEETEPLLFDQRQLEALQLIGSEMDNIRSALDTALQGIERTDYPLRLVSAISRYWFVRNNFYEAHSAIVSALERAEDGDPRLRAKALISLSGLFMQRRDFNAGWKCARDAVELTRTAADEQTHLRALGMAALAALYAPKTSGVKETHLELLELVERMETGRPALPYFAAGLAALRDADFPRAANLLQTALQITRRVGDPYDFGGTAAQLGLAKLQLDEAAQAAALFFESAQLSSSLFVESAELRVSFQFLANFAQCAEGLAYVGAEMESMEFAAELFGAAQALRDLCAAPLWRHWMPLQERHRAAAVRVLGETLFAEHYAFGYELAKRDAHASIGRFKAAYEKPQER
ncbi:MAG: ATP-binding protein [Vulcanimicrobiaceae bacterium]